MWHIYFDLYARLPDILELKNGSRQWQNVEIKAEKNKNKGKRKASTSSVTLLCCLKSTFFTVFTLKFVLITVYITILDGLDENLLKRTLNPKGTLFVCPDKNWLVWNYLQYSQLYRVPYYIQFWKQILYTSKFNFNWIAF